MPSFNQVILLGNLTRDPELRYTPQGVAVSDFSIAVHRKFNKKDGEAVEEVAFVDVTAWARLAEICAEFLKKGRPLLVGGRLAQDRWEDEATGQKRSRLRVVAETIQFLGSGSKDDVVSSEAGAAEEAAAPEAPAPVPPKGANGTKAAKPRR